MQKPINSNLQSSLYFRLLKYTFKHKVVFVLSVIAMAMFAITDTAFAALIKPLLDGSFVEKDPDTIRLFPFLLIGLFLLRSISGFISTYGISWVGRNVVKTIRQEMFDKLVHMPTKTYDFATSGELLSKLTYDTEQVAEAATKAITVLVRDGLTVVGLLGLMFYQSFILSIGLFVIGPVIAIFVKVMSVRFRDASKHIQESMGYITNVVEELIVGHRVVKIFGGEKSEKESFEGVNNNNKERHLKLALIQGISIPLVQFIVALFLSGVIYFVTSDEYLEVISVGTFMSFITAMILIFAPIKRLAEINVVLQRGLAASESVFKLLDSQSESDRNTDNFNKIFSRNFKLINFNKINFSYYDNDNLVLNDINFSIPKGTTCAIVGKSGSGKSTLINLLPRFYDIKKGNISIDDENINSFSLKELRGMIAYVGQDLTLFNDSIRNNIAYGSLENKSLEEVKLAAESANASDFIDNFDLGYETFVGDNGVLLSGGQRQRIAIARAILKDAPILLLDEATSSLDSESEKLIQTALDELQKNRTTIVIAHRLSTIEQADQIIVLDTGKIRERGKHSELILKKGLYAKLHQIQFPDL
ncbi:MAG: lipid A export permease/ATP-binding protein MsbA [Gammaproteobacteria bacterium]|jgi:ATP-binding cassette, subfamily B, bacterial MsbA|nr:lipid A export permease/ATP-binding protein MsbA [Gammaproteobacteria bacterium]MBT5406135.1 lipid A export permease/ATP-binding protein MsbA [Gammaproteobacteria bacterium]MBT5644282.1 lipid A export permease/ATP-binding protein MsbA [Gammaproteobacteria bacterium]MBT6733808.1 lipid A export permease/ATP-binding protein MsbA [Gammaproteobacteria bacterium]MBT7236823.1 lipid A export permease/ATP-binding protein MsbA [Gammaproteobacteria bacterium]